MEEHLLGLKQAIINNHLNVVEYFVENDFVMCDTYNALIIAAKYGKLSIVEYLVNKNFDIHKYAGMAFKFSIRNNHQDVTNYFLQKGCKLPIQEELKVIPEESKGTLPLLIFSIIMLVYIWWPVLIFL